MDVTGRKAGILIVTSQSDTGNYERDRDGGKHRRSDNGLRTELTPGQPDHRTTLRGTLGEPTPADPHRADQCQRDGNDEEDRGLVALEQLVSAGGLVEDQLTQMLCVEPG